MAIAIWMIWACAGSSPWEELGETPGVTDLACASAGEDIEQTCCR
jgi:hypothetical protein